MSRTSLRVNQHTKACLNVKELLARSSRYILSLSDSNEIQTNMSTYLYSVFYYMSVSCQVRFTESIHTL